MDQLKAMGSKQALSAPRSPWQRAYVERVIGTIRRECLDHVIVFGEGSLYHHLQRFGGYYQRSRTHLGLEKETPEPHPIQSADMGRIVSMPEVGGLQHRYERRAARGLVSRRRGASDLRSRSLKLSQRLWIPPDHTAR